MYMQSLCMHVSLCACVIVHVQLGAGTAVPGIVAALCGAHVILSDKEGNPRLQENLRETCRINKIPIGTACTSSSYQARGAVTGIMSLSWGVFSPEVLSLSKQDIVLASDCFYDSKGITLP